MEEETISSFAVRSLLVSGKVEIDKICLRFLFSTNMAWRVFPVANVELSKIFKGILDQQGVDNVFTNHTLLPLFRPVAALDVDHTYQNSFLRYGHNKCWPEIGKINSLHSNECVVQPIKYCPACFTYQVKNFGFTWFKREWLIVRMGMCLEHGCQLLIASCPCRRGKSSFEDIISAFRGECTNCLADLWTIHEGNTDSAFSSWLQKLLKVNLPAFSPALRAFLINQSYIKLGGDPEYAVEEKGIFLARLYDPWNIPLLVNRHGWNPKIEARSYHAEIKEALNMRLRPVMPHICLFHPLSLAFPDVNKFLLYLDNVSQEIQQTHNLRKISFPMRDLISRS